MNRSLIEGDPHAVLEGMLIAAYAIGAAARLRLHQGRVPARHRPSALRPSPRPASSACSATTSWAPSFSFDVTLKEGAGAFVCGEETALIASIEGRRGMPRTRPPFPAVSGLWGRPTIIDNVETLATLPAIIGNGADWYAGHGTAASKGTKTFALVGKVRRTGLIEVPFGTTLAHA